MGDHCLGTVIGIPSCILLIVGFLVYQQGMSVKRKSQRVDYHIGNADFVVHERDLSLATPVAMGMTQAEILKASIEARQQGREELFQEIDALNKMNSKTLQAWQQQTVAAIHDGQAALPSATPTFQELLRQRMIAPGKPLICGYEH